MKGHVKHLSCPSCGGTLAFKEGERVSECPSCSTKSLVEIKDHIPKYMIEPGLDLRAAKLAAMRLLAETRLAPDVKKKARFYGAGLYYLPMYEMSGQRIGKFVSTDVVRKNDVTTETKKANVLLRDVNHQTPAIRLGDWGLEHIRLEKLRHAKPLKPFDPGKIEKEAHVFDSTLPPEVVEIGSKKFSSAVAGDETKLLRTNLRLVFCPVWLIKYTYHNRLYRLVIDAVSGNVLFGRAPARDTERIPVMLVTLALITYPLSRLARLLIGKSLFSVAVGAGSALIYLFIPISILLTFMIFFLASAWNQFRYSGEVVWRGEHIEVERVNKPPETSMEKLGRVLSEVVQAGMDDMNMEIERKNRWYGGGWRI